MADAEIDTTDSLDQRAQRALDLRAAGFNWDQIAERAGYHDRSAAHTAVQRLIKRGLGRATDEQREVESRRLDQLWRAFFPAALQGDVKAGRLCLDLSSRRAGLWGLNVNEARMAGALEASAIAEVAAISMWHGSLMQAMTLAGVEPAQQQAVIENLNVLVERVGG